MSKVLITTIPFADKNRLPLDLLENRGIEYLINPFNKKLTENELIEVVADFDVIIAGTELITKKVMDAATNLKMISRVGVTQVKHLIMVCVGYAGMVCPANVKSKPKSHNNKFTPAL